MVTIKIELNQKYTYERTNNGSKRELVELLNLLHLLDLKNWMAGAVKFETIQCDN